MCSRAPILTPQPWPPSRTSPCALSPESSSPRASRRRGPRRRSRSRLGRTRDSSAAPWPRPPPPAAPRGAVDGGLVHHPEAEVVQPWRVRVVRGGSLPRRPQRVGELAVVVEEVGIAAYCALTLAEAQDGHDAIVELLGTPEIPDRHEDVVHADHFHCHLVSPSQEASNTASAADGTLASFTPSSGLRRVLGVPNGRPAGPRRRAPPAPTPRRLARWTCRSQRWG
jgi:hypothetical protein